MRYLICLLLCAVTLYAQATGAVTTTAVTTITATAPATSPVITCTFTAAHASVTVACSGAGATLSSTFAEPIPAPGTVGTFSLSGNTITWSLTPGTNVTNWQVVANGTTGSGSF